MIATLSPRTVSMAELEGEEIKHGFHFTSKEEVHQYIHEQSMNYISLQEVLTRALVHVKMY